MTIRARCPHCDGELAFDDAEGGTERECPTCHGGLRVPALIYYSCITCEYRYQSGPQHIGRHFDCRQCGERLEVPAESLRPTRTGGEQEPAFVGGFGGNVDRADFTDGAVSGGESTSDDWFDDDDGDGAEGGNPLTAQPNVAPRPLAPPERAIVPTGVVRRAGAFLIDVVILAAAQYVGGIAIGLAYGLVAGAPDQFVLDLATVTGAVIVPLVYFAVSEASERRASVGKGMLRLAVTDTTGARLSYPRALLRTLMLPVALLPLGIGVLMTPFTPDKRALHDMIAGSKVILA